MSSVSQYAQIFRTILEEDARPLAHETGLIQRERAFDGADFAISLIFGWLQQPERSLEGLVHVLRRREVTITASGLTQRFGPASAAFFQQLLQKLAAAGLKAEEPSTSALLRRFPSVVLEDSSIITLPPELVTVWQGCGAAQGANAAAMKLFVRWDVRSGQLWGPSLTDGKHNDHRSPLPVEDLPAGALYLADLGFFSLQRLGEICQDKQGNKRFVISRVQAGTVFYTQGGHRLELRGVLPRQEREAKELGVRVGANARLPMRLIMVRVPAETAQKRRKELRDTAIKHRREPSAEALYLADWTLLITNVPPSLLSLPEVMVLLRLRWQIELLFKLWKEHGHIDEWRSKKPWRVLTELYAKLCAMLIQQWIIHEGCWSQMDRSIVKAAQVVRNEAGSLMNAFTRGTLEAELSAVMRLLKGPDCRINHRGDAHPSMAQLLELGTDGRALCA